MVNNSTNTDKIENYLSPQFIEHKKNHDICQWKSMSWTATTMWLHYTDITKHKNPAQIGLHSKDHILSQKINNNINKDSTITGSMNTHS